MTEELLDAFEDEKHCAEEYAWKVPEWVTLAITELKTGQALNARAARYAASAYGLVYVAA